MLLKLAWRNIWRNPVRSLIVIFANVIGVLSIIFLIGMMTGMIDNYIDSAIKIETSHIQIHNPQYPEEKDIKYFISDKDSILDIIDKNNDVAMASVRTIVNGMLASSRSSRGIEINGIDAAREGDFTGIADNIVEGKFLNNGRNQIVISKRLAEKLKVRLKSKVILTFQSLNNQIVSNAFKIVGIFDSKNNMFDEANVFVNINNLNTLLGKDDIGHEVIIYLKDIKTLQTDVDTLKSEFPDLLVQSYKEIAPELDLFAQQIGMTNIIYMIVFLLALIFGIINTMLMAVLERVRELGMLMAIGMNKVKVFFMIVLETLILGFIGTPLGLFFAFLMMNYFGKYGLDLKIFNSEGMEQFGMSTFIYPRVSVHEYFTLASLVFLTAFLASIYPAIKAIKLKPAEAIRKI
ncbi:MAG: FtsX-like permease family protein [Saprospiraceae bacterium]